MSTINCLLLFTHILILILSKCTCKNYCSHHICNNSKQHTLCKYQSKDPAPHCFDYEKIVQTDSEKKEILDKINSRRNKVAAGEIKSIPSAGNMLKLKWHTELEISAQRWANQCIKHRVPDIKDACRDIDDIFVGQNIATIHGDAPGLTPVALVDVWYMELLNTNASIFPRFQTSTETGHSHYNYFTQLVWAESSHVGCGGVKFKERLEDRNGERNRTIYRLVCNFAPGGNQRNQTVYINGLPCTKCPPGGICDSVYKALCTSESSVVNKQRAAVRGNLPVDDQIELIPKEIAGISSKHYSIDSLEPNEITSFADLNSDVETTTQFDYFSDLHEFTKENITVTYIKRDTCKDEHAVDDFIQLLKKKLSSDPMFKDLLFSTKSLPQIGSDTTFTDASVAAFVSRIYSKKEPVTTTKLPESEYLNSTLLVDLVEAVIFRNSVAATEEVEQNTQSTSEVNPIKIQAELAEVKQNHGFTGHYFFPEDDVEETETDTTESYYDTSYLPLSDVVLEIQDIKKNTVTNDFLDEILELDLATESATALYSISPDDMNVHKSGHSIMKKFLEDIKEKTTELPAEDATRTNESGLSTCKPLFEMYQNFTKRSTPNLKLNVFDKKLSDEMLSIEKSFFNKNINHKSSTQKATPTLEVKQRWPSVDFLTNGFYKNKINSIKELDNKKGLKIPREGTKYISVQNDDKDKILGPRSLPEITAPYYNSGQKCNCIRSNPPTTCTHKCTEKTKCTHSSDCIQTTLSYTAYPAFYMPYQSYFLNDPNSNPFKNTYYHPDVLNELKIPKEPKYRKTTKVYLEDDLYYDIRDDKGKHYYSEYYNSDDRGSKNKHKQEKGDILINIDYDLIKENNDKDSNGKNKWNIGDKEGNHLSKHQLVRDIVEDLNAFYSDSSEKKCYCSSTIQKMVSEMVLFFCLMCLRHF